MQTSASKIRVLFIPFDATGSSKVDYSCGTFQEKNSKNGVSGQLVSSLNTDEFDDLISKGSFSKLVMPATNKVMNYTEINDKLPTVIESIIASLQITSSATNLMTKRPVEFRDSSQYTAKEKQLKYLNEIQQEFYKHQQEQGDVLYDIVDLEKELVKSSTNEQNQKNKILETLDELQRQLQLGKIEKDQLLKRLADVEQELIISLNKKLDVQLLNSAQNHLTNKLKKLNTLLGPLNDKLDEVEPDKNKLVSLKKLLARTRLQQRRLSQSYPELIFLSEKHKKVEFGTTIKLHGGLLTYHKLDTSAGTVGKFSHLQTISAYYLEDPTRSCHKQWSASELVVNSPGFKSPQHMLVVTLNLSYSTGVNDSPKTYKIAGVHLTAKNTGLNWGNPAHQSKIQKELKALDGAAKNHDIDAFIGDFNLSMEMKGGFRGSHLSGTTIVAEPTGVVHNVYLIPHSNCADDKFFMGIWLPENSRLFVDKKDSDRGQANVGTRAMADDYFSDHPPVYVELSRKYTNKMVRSNTFTFGENYIESPPSIGFTQNPQLKRSSSTPLTGSDPKKRKL